MWAQGRVGMWAWQTKLNLGILECWCLYLSSTSSGFNVKLPNGRDSGISGCFSRLANMSGVMGGFLRISAGWPI